MFYYFIFWIMVILLIIWTFVYFKVIEHLYCSYIRKQPPMVPTEHVHHAAVANEINRYYPKARTVCEIGSGYGNMARYIARHTGCTVTGVENMPLSVLVSRVWGIFCPRMRTVWADAYAYLDDGHKFDVAVAYLGTAFTPRLVKYSKNFHVLISCNFEIPNLRPTRVIDLGRGYVTYRHKKYPHKLFVYEF